MQRFTELRVWQRSHGLALSIYRATRAFPTEERFGITAQIRRAAVSVPTNIAEGSKRVRHLDFARFLNMAEGSLAEVEYLLMLSIDLGLLGDEAGVAMIKESDEIGRMLATFRTKVEAEGRAIRKTRDPRPKTQD
jgi:four helix bundle protein